MPRAYSNTDFANLVNDPGAGEWQALRGELVALLDKVENHYVAPEHNPAPAVDSLARRVRDLRVQVTAPETNHRREEALRSVKRTVERFSERDTRSNPLFDDELTAAIAEIRQRQTPRPEPVARPQDNPELRDLGRLVLGMSQRLEDLEGELKDQRGDDSQITEVASQVDQLTQVVELIAGAVGETGQVKRLEAQIAALGVMIEKGSRTDLSLINRRLDDVSATVGKLAELQAEQMERELIREERRAAEPARVDPTSIVRPAMEAINDNIRTVYDRIDLLERNVALSSGDLDRLTSELAEFTLAMRNNSAQPELLIERVEALADRLDGIDNTNSDVQALKGDISNLRNAVLVGLEPRFARIESQIDALNERIVPVDTSVVEDKLHQLMARMDEASEQIAALSRVYDQDNSVDYASIADLVATRATEAIARATPQPAASNAEDIQGLEKRMTALFNTAGKDTAERLARLEASLASRAQTAAPKFEAVPAVPAVPVVAPAPSPKPAPSALSSAFDADDAFAQSVAKKDTTSARLDSILASLSGAHNDAMPFNPAEDAPLVDNSFKTPEQPQKRMTASRARREAEPPAGLNLDPESIARPPRPQTSLGEDAAARFSDARPAKAAAPSQTAPTPAPESTTSTSTFVAAARRAQRARLGLPAEENEESVVTKALSRVLHRKEAVVADAPDVDAPEAAPKAKISLFKRRPKAEPVAEAPTPADGEEQEAVQPHFLIKHRRALLLTTALAAVSLLAVNLVVQRGDNGNFAEVAALQQTTAITPRIAPNVTPIIDPHPSSATNDTLIGPPVIDPSTTGSINSGMPMSFSRSGVDGTTELPPALEQGALDTLVLPDLDEAASSALVTTTEQSLAGVGETFELPAEAVGPLQLRQAAADGNAQAQFEVAAIFGEGRAVPQDAAEAAKWYERSAAQGFVPAQYRLGNLYEVGNGVEKNLEQAKLWYQRAADGGNRMAMHNLAALYAGGELGGQQFELAAEWFERAAERGMVDSQFNLGMLNARGLGVEQSFERSYKYFSLAALAGDKDAAQARSDIARSLSADVVQRLDAEVTNWKPQPLELSANFAPVGTWSEALDLGAPITTQDVVKRVQQALAKLGFDVGTPDGVTGPKTVQAIKSFERATGMSESGGVNPRLLAVLGSQPV